MRRHTALFVALAACRPDPGAPNYPNPGPWDPLTDDPDFLGGSQPYEDGEDRLSYGIFYEGGYSDLLLLDEVTRHFYIYEGTFGVSVSDDRVEGLTSDALTLTGNPWWGGGVHWDEATDLGDWDHLHIALKSSDSSLASWSIGMTGGGNEGRVNVSAAGFVPDGSWQDLSIPLADFESAGVDLGSVTVGLLLVGEGGAAGDTVLIDDLYLTRDP